MTAGVNKTRKHAPLERKRAEEKTEAEREMERGWVPPLEFAEREILLQIAASQAHEKEGKCG